MKCIAARRQIIRLILWLHVRYCWLSGWAGEINIWLELVANWLNPARYMWHDQKPKMLLSGLTSLDQSAFYYVLAMCFRPCSHHILLLHWDLCPIVFSTSTLSYIILYNSHHYVLQGITLLKPFIKKTFIISTVYSP